MWNYVIDINNSRSYEKVALYGDKSHMDKRRILGLNEYDLLDVKEAIEEIEIYSHVKVFCALEIGNHLERVAKIIEGLEKKDVTVELIDRGRDTYKRGDIDLDREEVYSGVVSRYVIKGMGYYGLKPGSISIRIIIDDNKSMFMKIDKYNRYSVDTRYKDWTKKEKQLGECKAFQCRMSEVGRQHLNNKENLEIMCKELYEKCDGAFIVYSSELVVHIICKRDKVEDMNKVLGSLINRVEDMVEWHTF